MNWRPHTEKPPADKPLSCVLAVHDEDGGAFLLGLKLWRDGRWVDEDNFDAQVLAPEFWWIPESELVATMPRQAELACKKRGGTQPCERPHCFCPEVSDG